jgi:hypothetical protein
MSFSAVSRSILTSPPKGSGRMELATAGRRFRLSLYDILFPPAPGGVGGRNSSKVCMEAVVKKFIRWRNEKNNL